MGTETGLHIAYQPGSRVDESKSPEERAAAVAVKVIEIISAETFSVCEAYVAMRMAGRGLRALCAALLAQKYKTMDHEDSRVAAELDEAVRFSKEALADGPVIATWVDNAPAGWVTKGSNESN